MSSECESHYPAGGRNRWAVEGNCVAARRGGEQPETEGWSQTKVNSIRHVQRASLLGKGEACRASGESVTAQGLPMLGTGRCGCGWSGNDRKGTWDKWRERPGSRREGSVAGRAFIVAMKPGNAGGAKERRKMKTPETVRNPTSSIAVRLERGSAHRTVRDSAGRLEAILETGCLHRQGHVGPTFLRPWFRYAINLSLRGIIIDWRAGCGKPACPVRREGRVLSLSLPLSSKLTQRRFGRSWVVVTNLPAPLRAVDSHRPSGR